MQPTSNGSDSQATEQRTPPPQWMPMQYPAAAMVMQHHMMPPQHYAPPPPQPYMAYHHYQQQLPHALHAHHQGSSAENKTVWVGDLHHWMDENYLHRCFASNGEVLSLLTEHISSIKVIRNKQTGLSEGYGFVEFYSHGTAEKVLQNYAGILMPNTEQPFRLNWATFGTGDKRSDNVPDLSIFVGDLAADVTDSMLHETFSNRYPSVKAAKVVFDANTGRSKGYGFVRFGDDDERSQAMTEMNGVYCSSRPMRIGAATPRKTSGYQQGSQSNGISSQSEADSTNTTESWPSQIFAYSEITWFLISNMSTASTFFRNNAEEALQKLNGTTIGKQMVRLSWGRNPANKQFRADFGNAWSGAYYGGPVYDGYGYALPPSHDPSIYAAAYGAYPIYGGHQQQVS
ncbi:hypothetical protein JHK86_014315 [Glycine max]|nr:hypothetical protein JHK86_014315 [Glycine max]